MEMVRCKQLIMSTGSQVRGPQGAPHPTQRRQRARAAQHAGQTPPIPLGEHAHSLFISGNARFRPLLTYWQIESFKKVVVLGAGASALDMLINTIKVRDLAAERTTSLVCTSRRFGPSCPSEPFMPASDLPCTSL